MSRMSENMSAELWEFRQQMQLTQAEAAEALQVKPRTLEKWEQGLPMSQPGLLRLAMLYLGFKPGRKRAA